MDNQIVKPLLVLRGIVILPGSTVHFDVGRDKSKKALRAAMKNGAELIMTAQRDASMDDPKPEELYQTGVLVRILQVIDHHEDYLHVVVTAKERVVCDQIQMADGYWEAKAHLSPVEEDNFTSEERTALLRELRSSFMDYMELLPKSPPGFAISSTLDPDPKKLVLAVCDTVMMDFSAKQSVLEEPSVFEQLFLLDVIIKREIQVLSMQKSIAEKVQQNIDDRNREHYIREQIQQLQQELPGGAMEDNLSDYEEFRKKIEAIKHIPDETRQKLLKECEHYARVINFPQEAAIARSYLEAVLSVPWDTFTTDHIDLGKAKKQLDKDHYGLTDVKKRIIELLAVRKLSPDIKGQILCLAGPPGVGKTSIASSIAKTMGRNFARISLGGIHDEADIRGHRKTYLGSMPGRIANAVIEAKSMNPVILMDEVDKMASDFRGNPTGALLEVLDAEQNHNFRDHYLEVGLDLSHVLFITTANNIGEIPPALRDRMEIIELSSYTREEKFNIAKKHLLPKELKSYGLDAKQCTIQKAAMYDLIDCYTKEAGVRNLERTIATVCRRAAVGLVEFDEQGNEGDYRFTLTKKNIEEVLGPRVYLGSLFSDEDRVGVVNGLAWTSVGGEILEIEVAVLEGDGKIKLTGSLGDVMKESAQLAISLTRQLAKEYGIAADFHCKNDIHLHAPEGAVPKDGPSAGVTMTTGLISALSGRKVDHTVAMTGEISLLGAVLPIGGLREKAMAAYKAGIKTVCIPFGNSADLAKVDDVVKENITFIPCRRIEDVLKVALKPKEESDGV